MKRHCLIWFMVAVVVMSMAVPVVSGLAANSPESDDVPSADGSDQRITLSDVITAARCMTGQITLSPEEIKALDPDGNGKITLSDVVTLAKRYVAQMSSPEPSETEPPAPEVKPSPGIEPSAPPATSGSPAPTSNPSGDVLVVYFSATGHTRLAAEYVAAASGADLVLSLEPTQPYTSQDLDYRNPNSRIYREYHNPSERVVPLVVDTVDNWESYNTVFIGYPIWWGLEAWPVDGFIRANDFAEKTVIPFCTSASSGVGESAHRLEQLAGGGTWLPARRFSADPSQDAVNAWVAGLVL